MHIGVEKPITKYLCEENLHAITRQFGDIDADAAQVLDLANRCSLHAFHDHDLLTAPIPVDFGYQ